MTHGPAPEPTPTKQWYQRWWVWVLIGASVVIGVAGRAASAGAEDGALVGSNFRVSDETAHSSAYHTDVASNPDATEYLVVWRDGREYSTRGSDIYAQRLSGTGSLLGSNVRVSDEMATSDEYGPAVVYNPDADEYLVVWVDTRDYATRGADIYAQRISSTGSPAGSNFRVSDEEAIGTDLSPAVGYSSNAGEYLIVWEDDRNEGTRGSDVFGQRVSTSGDPVGFNFRVSGKNATGDDWGPEVAYDPDDGEYLVVWSDRRESAIGSADIFAQRVSPSGSRVGFNFRVSGKNATGLDSDPEVAYDPDDGEYLVVWSDGRESAIRGADIFAQRVSPSGSRVGFNFRVSGKNATWIDQHAAVAYDPDDGEYLVVWGDGRKKRRDMDIFGQKVSPSGSRVGFNFRVSDLDAHDDQKSPAVAYNSDAGEHLVVWADAREYFTRGQDIFGQRVRP